MAVIAFWLALGIGVDATCPTSVGPNPGRQGAIDDSKELRLALEDVVAEINRPKLGLIVLAVGMPEGAWIDVAIYTTIYKRESKSFRYFISP